MGILPNCKDPALTALKTIGYNVVQLPRIDLRPGQLLMASGKRLQRLGELGSVFTRDPGDPPPPTMSVDRPGPAIAITKSAAMDAGVGLNILGGLISALGGSTLGLNLAYAKAKRIEMEYSGTLENNVEVALLDQFLAGASVNQFSKAAKQMLEKDMVYVVTSTLKAATLNVTATDSKKNSIGIDVPVLSNAIGGNLKVASSGEGSTKLTFKGGTPLVFGFQAIQLVFDNGVYTTFKPTGGGSVIAESIMSETEGAPALDAMFVD
jgi:hypothetical protein